MVHRGGKGKKRGGGGGRQGHGGGKRGHGGEHAASNTPSQFFGALNPHFAGASRSINENPPPSFSLADEARNTEEHYGEWKNATALRYTKINFASAGNLATQDLMKPVYQAPELEKPTAQTRKEEDDAESSLPDLSMEKSYGELLRDADIERLGIDSSNTELSEIPPSKRQETRFAESPGFINDLVGDLSLPLKDQILIRPRSPTPSEISSSSSEIIVFVPRKQRTNGASNGVPPKKTSEAVTQQSPPHNRPESNSPKGKDKAQKVTPTAENTETETNLVNGTTEVLTINDPISQPPAQTPEEEIPPIRTTKKWEGRSTPGNKRRKRAQRRKERKEEEKAAIEDYMENLAVQMRAEEAENGGENSGIMSGGFGYNRDLGGDDDEWVDDSSTDENEAAEDSAAIARFKSDMWTEDELKDFDNISTSDGSAKGQVDMILGKRKRPSGLQYLVKWAGYDMDDATWVLADTLDSSSDAKLKKYEEHLAMRESQMAQGSDGSSDESGKDNEGNHEDNDLKFAKLLQRQELGLYSDVDSDLDREADLMMAFDDNFFPTGKGKGKRRAKPPVPHISPYPYTGQYPSASRMADAYDGFDVMEWERPSLVTKAKGNTSDPELKQRIQSHWEKDREKKKVKKQEREALRAEGLLGKKAKKAALEQEITQFMRSTNETLSLPPMDKAKRRMVHKIASKFNLISKSTGTDKNRFTTLYKTSKSAIHEQDMHQPSRSDISGRNKHPISAGRGRKGSRVHHKEGDIVGGSAPEIPVENKGRIMLEKMGYKAGMSLGADSTRGIIVPVTAVVKVSKAGLG